MDNTNISVCVFIVMLFVVADNGLGAVTSPVDDQHRCAEFCRCDRNDMSALCDGQGNSSLEHGVPELPSFVQRLTIKSFNIESITKKTFSSVTDLHLTLLKINNCTIGDIEKDAFSMLSHCTDLELMVGYNVMSERVISKCFSALRTLSLKFLDLHHLNISDADGTVFDTLTGTSIKAISVAKNYLTTYNHSKFVNIANLTFLDLSGNDINKTMLTYSPRLKTLNLAYNRIKHFPNICRRHKPIFPNLELLKLDHNHIQYIHSRLFDCLKQLKCFDLGRNFFSKIEKNTFAYLPNLKIVRLRNMVYDIVLVDAYAFNNSNLKSIILRDNRMELQHALNRDSFAGCDSLEQLDLSYNQVTKLPHRNLFMAQLLGHLHTLKWLSLGNLILFEIPEIIMNLTNIEVLEVYTNYISKFPVGFFSRMKNLKELYIATNSFNSLDESDFPLESRNRLNVLSLYGNPFVCNCKLLWFIQWMRRSPETFGLLENYTCTTSDKSDKRYVMKDVNISVKTCLLSYETSLVIVGFSIFVTITVVTASLVYKWRWLIKYYIYMVRYEKRSRTKMDGNYSFDAFVIYCTENRSWIQDEAIPNLEENANLSLCIHERDFMAGALIVDNIVQSLCRSRKVILVLSNEFAKSRWCEFEMCLCQAYILDNKCDLMVAVLLEDIKSCYVSKSMYALLKTTTYCTWPGDDAQAKDMFWTQLRQALSST